METVTRDARTAALAPSMRGVSLVYTMWTPDANRAPDLLGCDD